MSFCFQLSVEAPTNTNPLFKSVKISVKGPITFHADLDLSIIIDYIMNLINKKAAGKRTSPMAHIVTVFFL